jgi:hypothetical protein
MTAAVSRAVMALARQCLGGAHEDWGTAMQAEFEAAVEDGKPFVFAVGCLIAAGRAMVRQREGRLVLTNYVLTLGLLLPIAALQFEQAIGLPVFTGGSLGGTHTGGEHNPYLAWSQNAATPILVIVWLLLGAAHLCLAWALVERDWPRVFDFGALIGAATIALSLFAGVLMLDLSPLVAQVAELGIELAAILAIARLHAQASSEPLAG